MSTVFKTGGLTDQELRIGYWIQVIASPILILVGIFGNVLTIIVLSRKELKRNVSSIYLTCLATSDLLTLALPVTITWISQVIDQDISAYNSAICKLYTFLLLIFRDVSSWSLVALSIERVIATLLPYKYRHVCIRRTAFGAVSIVITLAAFANGHIFFTFDVVPIGNGKESFENTCVHGSDSIFMEHWLLISGIKSIFLPGVIMLTATAIINWSLPQGSARRRRNTEAVQEMARNASKATPMSKVLLALNIMFICTQAPLILYGNSIGLFRNQIPLIVRIRDPVIALCIFINNLNLVVNFWAYIAIGTKFRQSLKKFLSEVKNVVVRQDGNREMLHLP